MILFKNVVIQVGKCYLQNINFHVKYKEHFYIVGKSGIGKTLILEILAGRYKPISGEVIVDGRDYTTIPIEEKNIGFVYQDFILYDFLTVYENIKLPLKLKKLDYDINGLLDYFDILNLRDRKVSTLSGGEKQRVAICRALIYRPKILLLDEAYNALDFDTKIKVRNKLELFANNNNITILEVTHDRRDIRNFNHIEIGDNGANYIK